MARKQPLAAEDATRKTGTYLLCGSWEKTVSRAKEKVGKFAGMETGERRGGRVPAVEAEDRVETVDGP